MALSKKIYYKFTDEFASKRILKLETVSIAEPLQDRQHAPLMLSTPGSKGKREGRRGTVEGRREKGRGSWVTI